MFSLNLRKKKKKKKHRRKCFVFVPITENAVRLIREAYCKENVFKKKKRTKKKNSKRRIMMQVDQLSAGFKRKKKNAAQP